jgi:C_GCAxxG_C_C family probable redox protein
MSEHHNGNRARTIDPARAAQEAAELFQNGWNCAESVFQAIHRQVCGGSGPVHLVTALGGGMASKKTCGALSGGIVALGLVYGRIEPDDQAKKAAYAQAKRLHADFRDQFHSVDCWQLTCHYHNLKQQKEGCTRLVRAAAQKACELIAKAR